MKNQSYPDLKKIGQKTGSDFSDDFLRISNSINHTYNQLTLWFKQLPPWGQGVAIVSTIIVGIKVLETILKLISLSISLLIIGGGIYLVYKFFISRTSSESNTNTKIKK
ncbi:MAG: hypothetical protein QNJ68_08820 [Microcoleaceae cyanobacterium MO_207.B10]|nr:hypothetical protein [Microcoleaceae cyanobacterium MO_207.B10]